MLWQFIFTVCYCVRFVLGVGFIFDVSNGIVKDGDVTVDCGKDRKS